MIGHDDGHRSKAVVALIEGDALAHPRERLLAWANPDGGERHVSGVGEAIYKSSIGDSMNSDDLPA